MLAVGGSRRGLPEQACLSPSIVAPCFIVLTTLPTLQTLFICLLLVSPCRRYVRYVQARSVSLATLSLGLEHSLIECVVLPPQATR